MRSYPSVSIVIPTLNAASVLEECLRSIEFQNYPKKNIEIIVADASSNDNTRTIAKKYGARIVDNKLKTGEAGKSAGVKASSNELIALIDSDNILPDKNWLTKMVEPFADKEIIVSEPIKYTYRKSDPYLTRYFALLGMNDPICLFTGNYDRYSHVTGKWTELNFPIEDKGKYLKVNLISEPIPTIGANGTIFRSNVLKKSVKNFDYLFDIDILLKLLRENGSVKVAKVKTGIIHTFVEDDPLKFFRKQLRRMDDMSFHKAKKNRDTDWEKSFFGKIVLFQIECLLIVPIIYQMWLGYRRKNDVCWLFHPVAVYSTLFIYLFGWVKGKLQPTEASRKNWKQ